MQAVSFYKVKDNSRMLDGEGKQYHLRIRDLPAESKPREKLLKFGPQALSAVELMAVLLGNGSRKEGVLQMSERIIKEYGEGAILNEHNPEKLSKNFGVPIVKSMQIVACAELGRRFFDKGDMSLPTIRTARSVYEYVQDMRGLAKEHLRGIYLNSHYKVIHSEIISIGTVDANIIHPREVFKPALLYSAVAVILVHNHPSGELEPSSADVEVTKQVADAGRMIGVDLVDHVIVTKDSFNSIPIK